MKLLKKKGDTQRYGKVKALLKLEVFNLLRSVVVDLPDRPNLRQKFKGHTFVSMEAHLLIYFVYCYYFSSVSDFIFAISNFFL